MSYEYEIETFGVTGQRPRSLGMTTFDPKDPVWTDAYWFVRRSIAASTAKRLISGGALGFDMIAGKAAVDCGIHLSLYMPFEGYDSWSDENKRRLQWLVEHAEEAKYICSPGQAAWKYQERNEAIVERSDYLLAFWNGKPGGTGNCLKAAKQAGVPYHVHDPTKLLEAV